MKKLEEDVLLLEDQNSKFVKVKEKAIIEIEKERKDITLTMKLHGRKVKI